MFYNCHVVQIINRLEVPFSQRQIRCSDSIAPQSGSSKTEIWISFYDKSHEERSEWIILEFCQIRFSLKVEFISLKKRNLFEKFYPNVQRYTARKIDMSGRGREYFFLQKWTFCFFIWGNLYFLGAMSFTEGCTYQCTY